MMSLLRALVCMSVVLLGLSQFSPRIVAQEAIPGWHTNLDEARKLAETTGKPLFITFRCVR